MPKTYLVTMRVEAPSHATTEDVLGRVEQTLEDLPARYHVVSVEARLVSRDVEVVRL
jgi:hypothetical protein